MSVVSFDSVDKLKHYLLMLSLEPDGDNIPPKYLVVSRSFWGNYTCPPGCGGCCRSNSIDYFEDEFEQFALIYPDQVQHFQPYEFLFFGRKEVVFSNRLLAKKRYPEPWPLNRCMFLDGIARCNIHEANPFSCRFELNKLDWDKKRDRAILRKKLFGRGWNYTRISDKQKGALCEMVPVTLETVENTKRRDVPMLERLIFLLNKWGVKHRGNELLELLDEQYNALKQGVDIKNITIVRTNDSLELW